MRVSGHDVKPSFATYSTPVAWSSCRGFCFLAATDGQNPARTACPRTRKNLRPCGLAASLVGAHAQWIRRRAVAHGRAWGRNNVLGVECPQWFGIGILGNAGLKSSICLPKNAGCTGVPEFFPHDALFPFHRGRSAASARYRGDQPPQADAFPKGGVHCGCRLVAPVRHGLSAW